MDLMRWHGVLAWLGENKKICFGTRTCIAFRTYHRFSIRSNKKKRDLIFLLNLLSLLSKLSFFQREI